MVSITTVGGTELRTIFSGSTSTIPLPVANSRLPWNVFDPIGCELPILIPNQARTNSSEPHYIVRVFIDTGGASGQKTWIVKALEFAIFYAREAIFRAEPNAPFMILKNHPHAVRPPVFL